MAVSLAPKISAGGNSLDAATRDQLTFMRVDRQIGLVGRATLRFQDFGAKLASANKFFIGAAVTISSPSGTEVFEGKVTGISLDQGEGHLPELVIVIDDGAYNMALKSQTKATLNSSYGTIIDGLLTGTGLSKSTTAPDSAQQPYVLQSGSNLDMLNDICTRTGRVWWVDGTSLKWEKIGTSSGTVSLEFNSTDLHSFSVKATALKPDGVQVVGWDPAQQQEISATFNTAVTKESDLVANYPGRKSGSNTLVIRDASPLTADEATAIATSVFKAVQSEAVVAKGVGDFNSSIKPGVKVTVTKAGPASGSYLVSAVEHIYDSRGFVTKFTAGPAHPQHLVDVLAAESKPDSGFTIDGVLPAVVTNVADPDNLGRVKVKYSTQGATVESPWARIATIGAGFDEGGSKGRGFEFQPEVNDEVLIAFELGDTRRPVVLGGLYSAKNKLPKSPAAGNVDNNKIKFRRITSRLGHVIELADGQKPEEKYIKIGLEDGKTFIQLGEDKTDITLDSKVLTISNSKGKIILAENGDITLEGNNVTIKAKANVSIEGATKTEVKGGQVAINGDSQLQVKSGGVGSVEASGPLTVKGAMVAIN